MSPSLYVGDIEEPATLTRANLGEPKNRMKGSLSQYVLLRLSEVLMLTVYAHCDLPCGVYDPAQAKIEAQSVKACMEKYAASTQIPISKRALLQSKKRVQIW